MAQFRVNSAELTTVSKLATDSRENIRRILMAGAQAAERRMADRIRQRRHVRNGDMLESTGNTGYQEYFGGGSTEVYPQGEDRRGVRNATKAFVINYGRGGVKRNGGKMGDRFITSDEKAAEALVTQAMQAESDRIADEADKE